MKISTVIVILLVAIGWLNYHISQAQTDIFYKIAQLQTQKSLCKDRDGSYYPCSN